MKRVIPLLVVLCATVALARTDDFWNHKPYESWTAEECHRLLTDSPWAKTVVDARRVPMRARGFGQFPNSEQQSGVDVHSTSYTAVLMSALPVRQAISRLAELQAKNHAAANSPDLVANAKELLAADYSDRVVVRMFFKSNVPGEVEDFRLSWSQMSPDESRAHASLSSPQLDPIRPTSIETDPSSQVVDALFARDVRVAGGKPQRMEFTFSRKAVSSVTRAQRLKFMASASVQRLHQTGRSSIDGQMSCSNGFCGSFSASLEFNVRDLQFDGNTVY